MPMHLDPSKRLITRTMRRSSMWRQRITVALSLGSSMRSFDATHLLVLLFPTLGMIPAVAAASTVYLQTRPQFRNESEADPMLRFTPITFYPEPFAALSNLCFVTSGLALFMLPMLSGSFIAPHVFGVGMLYSFLGAGSWAFHKDASRVGTWQHAADRIGMYSAFGYLGVVVMSGAFHSLRRAQVLPRSWSMIISNMLCMAAVMLCIVYQDHIESLWFLGGVGTLVVSGNGLTTAMLAMHRTRTEAKIDVSATSAKTGIQPAWVCQFLPRWCNQIYFRFCLIRGWLLQHRRAGAVLEGLLEAGLCCLLLLVGLSINGVAAQCRDMAAHNNTLSDAERQSLRMRHDMLHGTWHYLAAMAMLTMALTMHRGLCINGAEVHRRPGAKSESSAVIHREEGRSKAILMLISLTFMILLPSEQPIVYVFIWIMLLLAVLPFSMFGLLAVLKRNDENWADRVAALRNAAATARAATMRPKHAALTTTV